MLETGRLWLKPFEAAHFEAIFTQNLLLLGQILSVETPEKWTTFDDMAEALPFFYTHFKNFGTAWGAFFMTHKTDKCLVGTCGFKGLPDTEGVVEIGYEVRPDYRERGLATEVVHSLAQYAFDSGQVQAVVAHTLAVESASVSVLRKKGFLFDGFYVSDEDGDVWRWRLDKDGFE